MTDLAANGLVQGDGVKQNPDHGQRRGFRTLDGAAVLETVERLEQRIVARFPERNLAMVARELREIVADTLTASWHRSRRLRAARWLSMAVIAALVGTVLVAFSFLAQSARGGPLEAADWPSFFESVINDFVFAGIAIYFVWLWPARFVQKRTLEALHELRSVAHVIDMHQLTKDPERLRPNFKPTSASYTEDLTADELSNYLDYCSELLSMVSKTAALHGERTSDGTVLAAIQGIEELTTGMSRKIWQKIALLPQNRTADPLG